VARHLAQIVRTGSSAPDEAEDLVREESQVVGWNALYRGIAWQDYGSQALPYEDDTFDLVTGFNSFFFAADLVAALREARRVAKPGAPVVIQVWGPPERNDLEAMKQVARRYAPPPPPDAPPPPKLWQPGVLEELASEAGLEPEAAFDTSYSFDFADAETLGRLLMAPMGLAELVGPEREHQVRGEIIEALAPYRRPDGSYRLRNEFHFLIGRA
jgi:SAM-dependent methyltransferase